MANDLTLQSAKYYAQVLKDLNSKFIPHDGQINVGNALFYNNKKLVVVECGRKWGKTEFICYVLYRWLMTVFNGGFYYFCDLQKQANEIMWASGRLPYYLPKEMADKYKITLHPGSRIRCGITNSFIKLDGSDSFDDHRGTNPHGSVYDEYKDFRPELHAAYGPNHATHQAPLLVCGTPPETEDPTDVFNAMVEEVKADTDGAHFVMPSWVNPHISKDYLLKQKDKLFKLGRQSQWYREYCAIRMKDEQISIFPMLNKTSHVMPHAEIIELLKQNKKHIEWQCIADPAASTVFAILLRAYNPYTKVIYRVGEMYEKVPAEMTTRKIWAKLIKKLEALNPNLEEWVLIYDEAESWFANEMLDVFEEQELNLGWAPTMKSRMKKDDGINLIREQMLCGKYIMSDQCLNLYWELDNYRKDRNGRVPKKNDHLIDCERYGDDWIQIGIRDLAPPPEIPEDKIDRRGFTVDEDIEDYYREQDINYISGVDEELYE